ncbi:DUF2141 domain-containing protein [Sphingomonas naphthae]|uniref:DUF2141 domain-containing protein n=1 Tax=Sphingomonas naphthae TaxID=1813468 RepID=A0ABY7TJ74_9SPHN|nr:DUF2141 domain-containing protein [Sphingomonas naphthae]WCT73267.1 DUF2141 domain-containing protein [Sphingomonas naphthae]
MRLATFLLALVLVGASPDGRVDLDIEGLRSKAGLVQVCMTMRADLLTTCEKDPAARRATIPAAAGALSFADLPSGAYAIALFHDENGNGKLDTRLGIPLEGVGFSRNPKLWFGPPRFSAAQFRVTGGAVNEAVKLKYFF